MANDHNELGLQVRGNCHEFKTSSGNTEYIFIGKQIGFDGISFPVIGSSSFKTKEECKTDMKNNIYSLMETAKSVFGGIDAKLYDRSKE